MKFCKPSIDRADVKELYNRYHLAPEQIVKDVMAVLK